jgi:hypothetical protein
MVERWEGMAERFFRDRGFLYEIKEGWFRFKGVHQVPFEIIMSVVRHPSSRHKGLTMNRDRPAKMAYEINRLRADLIKLNKEVKALQAQVSILPFLD